jgi:hypothetical protein
VAVLPPSDEELDILARTQWALMGIDISVLPVSDPAAVVDQVRCLTAARNTLRQEAEIAAYVPDLQANVAVLYPAPFSRWTGDA